MKASYSIYAKLRDERGYTDYRVANETNIRASAISDWKNGICVPNTGKLYLIAKLFKVTIEDFFEED